MSELALAQSLPRESLLVEVRSQLHCPPLSLQVVASDVLGLDGSIDWLAVGADRGIVLGFLAPQGQALATLAHGLAQRAWVAPRVRDWLQLAPRLDVDPRTPPQVLILAPDFCPRSLALQDTVESGCVELVRFHCVRNGSNVTALLDPVRQRPAPPEGPSLQPATISPAFRTGLSDEELGLSASERSEFEA